MTDSERIANLERHVAGLADILQRTIGVVVCEQCGVGLQVDAGPMMVGGRVLCDRPTCHAAHIATLPAEKRQAARADVDAWWQGRGGEQGKKPEEG